MVVLCHWEALNDWLLRPPSLSVLGAGVAEDNCWFQCHVQQCPLEQRAQAAVCNCWIDGFIVSCGLQGKTLAGHTIPASAQLCSCRLPASFFLMMDAVIPALWMNQKGKNLAISPIIRWYMLIVSDSLIWLHWNYLKFFGLFVFCYLSGLFLKFFPDTFLPIFSLESHKTS